MLRSLTKPLLQGFFCFWVREQGGSPAQHYHLVVIVNGHKCSSNQYILKVATEIWESQKGRNYNLKVKSCIWRIEKYKNNNEYQATRMRMSYLAKMKTKDISRPCLNSFGVSRIAPNPLTNKNT